MKKIIIENTIVEIDEKQEYEVSQLFPELGAALKDESEVRIELIGSLDEVDEQLEDMEGITRELERCIQDIQFVNQSTIRPD
jgi:hypothetical protein